MKPVFVHRDLDPRAKLSFVIVIAALAVTIPRLASFAALGAVLVAVVALGRGLAFREWLGFLAPFKVLIPVVFVLNAFFYRGGSVLWDVPVVPVALTVGGIHASAVIAARLVILAGAAAWFAVTTDQEAFEEALVRMGVPWSFAFVLSLTIQLVPVMRDRFRIIDEAQRSRGLVFEGGPLRRARARIPMLIPFFVSVVNYGYELSEALVVRDFGRVEERTSVVRLEYAIADYLFYSLSVAVLAAFAAVFLV